MNRTERPGCQPRRVVGLPRERFHRYVVDALSVRIAHPLPRWPLTRRRGLLFGAWLRLLRPRQLQACWSRLPSPRLQPGTDVAFLPSNASRRETQRAGEFATPDHPPSRCARDGMDLLNLIKGQKPVSNSVGHVEPRACLQRGKGCPGLAGRGSGHRPYDHTF